MALKDQIGSFCWWSLMTKDVEQATAFYQQLFGWKLDKMDIPGHGPSDFYATDSGGFAHPVLLEADFPGPSHWMTYVVVEDVDKACDRAKELGGSVCVPAFDIPSIGRTAVIGDPAGATFHLFTPAQDEEAMNMIGNGLGEICWMELMVDDPAALLPFYSELLGWQFAAPMAMIGTEYTSFESNGVQGGGLLKRPPGVPQTPPHWLTYFAVPSAGEWADKAEALGGKIVVPKTPIPETGFFAMIEDPTGAHSYLFEMTAS